MGPRRGLYGKPETFTKGRAPSSHLRVGPPDSGGRRLCAPTTCPALTTSPQQPSWVPALPRPRDGPGTTSEGWGRSSRLLFVLRRVRHLEEPRPEPRQSRLRTRFAGIHSPRHTHPALIPRVTFSFRLSQSRHLLASRHLLSSLGRAAPPLPGGAKVCGLDARGGPWGHPDRCPRAAPGLRSRLPGTACLQWPLCRPAPPWPLPSPGAP